MIARAPVPSDRCFPSEPHAPGALSSRWFSALDDEDPLPPPIAPPRFPRHAIALAACGLLALVAVRSLEVRASLATGFLAATVVIVVHWLTALTASRTASASGGRSSMPSKASRAKPARGVALEGDQVSFVAEGSSHPIGRAVDALFGVTLLASPRRERVIALLSSAQGTFYLGSTFDAAARRAFAPLLDRAFTIVGDDVAMEPIGPDGAPLVLAPEELASLLDALVERSPACLDRFVVTDARGTLITLDGQRLRVGDRAVDLSAPLEWKPIVFQEAFGQAIAVYQGTWIRQSATELTLVSLMPALGPAPTSDLDLSTLDRSVLRDLRLMQATPESPPPNEQRIAIDRLFMLPVRSALDCAPRISMGNLEGAERSSHLA